LIKVKSVSLVRYVIVSVASGVLFAVLDGLINANPLARDFHKVYEPIARAGVNIVPGIVIDLAYGFVLAGLFLLLYKSLPGRKGVTKGICFGLMLWFFRTVMCVASSWMMFDLPGSLLLYTLFSGLGELLVLGIFYGIALNSPAGNVANQTHKRN